MNTPFRPCCHPRVDCADFDCVSARLRYRCSVYYCTRRHIYMATFLPFPQEKRCVRFCIYNPSSFHLSYSDTDSSAYIKQTGLPYAMSTFDNTPSSKSDNRECRRTRVFSYPYEGSCVKAKCNVCMLLHSSSYNCYTFTFLMPQVQASRQE